MSTEQVVTDSSPVPVSPAPAAPSPVATDIEPLAVVETPHGRLRIVSVSRSGRQITVEAIVDPPVDRTNPWVDLFLYCKQHMKFQADDGSQTSCSGVKYDALERPLKAISFVIEFQGQTSRVLLTTENQGPTELSVRP